MKKKVSIARALKEKNRVAGQLVAIQKIISNNYELKYSNEYISMYRLKCNVLY